MIRLLIRRGASDPETNAFGRGRHCAYDSQWLIDWPLRTADDGGLKASIIHIVPSQHVGDEDTMELRSLEQFGEFYPVLNVAKLMRVVVWMPP